MNTRNNIDDLFRDAMDGYTVEPSYGLWRRIERRFFPPSRFSPNGLITPIILLFIAGLMPWLLIPANHRDETQPNLPEGGSLKQGYLIEADADGGDRGRNGEPGTAKERRFTVKPAVYVEFPADPAADSGSVYIASVNDPVSDPAILPLLQAIQKQYLPAESAYDPLTASETRLWISRMMQRGSGLINHEFTFSPDATGRHTDPLSAFSRKYENDYFKSGEWSVGADFSPSVVFYDPNPSNQMLGLEASVQYSLHGISIRGGLGVSRMEDVASYRIDYETYDSVGFYLDVVSFYVDPLRPGEVIFNTRQEAIYDSVPHFVITEKTNYYTYLDFPLAVGYELLKGRRVYLSLFAGVKFSALVHKEEPTVVFETINAELTGIERQVPARLGTTWRFTAGMEFGYLFAQNFSLHLEPVFEQYLTPVYSKQEGYLPEKPYVIGVKAGFRYNF
jgi:hypothetical protein